MILHDPSERESQGPGFENHVFFRPLSIHFSCFTLSISLGFFLFLCTVMKN